MARQLGFKHAVTFFVFLAAAAVARIVAPQLRHLTTIRSGGAVIVIVLMIAVRTVNVLDSGRLGHGRHFTRPGSRRYRDLVAGGTLLLLWRMTLPSLSLPRAATISVSPSSKAAGSPAARSRGSCG